MKIAELAELIGADVESVGQEHDILSVAPLNLAGSGDITFLSNPKYTPQVDETNASAIITSRKTKIERNDIAVLRADDPYLAYARALHVFHPAQPATAGIHPSAIIDETATVAADAEIMANAVIGKYCVIESSVRIYPNVTVYDNAKIGEGSVLHSGVSVRENCEIGKNCILHNNVTIGSDGFGYAKDENKAWFKIPQTGRVVLEDDVEIGANSSIDCATIGETRIRRGAKIDNLVQIGHSCSVDEDTLICAQTGLAGSSHIGKRVILAGQVGIAGHLKVGDDVVVTAKSATSHDVEPGKVISGIPAFDNRDWLRSTAAFRRLGELSQKIRKLEKKIESILP